MRSVADSRIHPCTPLGEIYTRVGLETDTEVQTLPRPPRPAQARQHAAPPGPARPHHSTAPYRTAPHTGQPPRRAPEADASVASPAENKFVGLELTNLFASIQGRLIAKPANVARCAGLRIPDRRWRRCQYRLTRIHATKKFTNATRVIVLPKIYTFLAAFGTLISDHSPAVVIKGAKFTPRVGGILQGAGMAGAAPHA